ncbi:MAG TPA: nitrate/sulfonate/bicarbonate ABC transporter ATP-binding protein [Casimicrobiaceae bacterium]|nr:nitrate/sulfonate/bicarbonate ABC transporter ATP-binding protein [Casimicrobiaceae bacterium]
MPADILTADRLPEARAQRASGAQLIELRRVSKSYMGAEGSPPVTVLDDINLEVGEGEVVALLGQSGSGKSTILRLMAGLTSPTQGSVLSHGAPLVGINRSLSIVFQSFALYPWLTVQENVQIGLIQRRLEESRQQEEIERALELIALSGYENAYPKQLSGGMRQRVGFARALVAQPEVLCMDEPFSALDVLTAESLRTQVIDLWRSSQHAGLKSIFLVTHSIAEAVFTATRIVIISSHPGRVRNVIVNPLPYPRDVNSRSFADLVDQVHAAITALVLPDEPVEEPRAAAAAAAQAAALTAAPPSGRIEPVPNVPVETIVGLLEIIEDAQETINVFDLSARIGKEFGETIATVKAAEMLDLVDTPKDDVLMTQAGWYFLAAPTPARRALFRQAILKLRLFQMLTSRLAEAPEGRLDAESVLEWLGTLLPYDQPARMLETLVGWGRYAELVDFDQDSNTVHLHEASTEGEDRGMEASS